MQQDAHVLTHDAAKVRTIIYGSRAEWLRARRAFITSTDVAALAGLSKYQSPLSIFQEKKKADSADDETDVGNERMLLGRIFQRDIATAYQVIRERVAEERYEVEHVPEYALFQHASNKRHGTSLDCRQWAYNGELRPSDPRLLQLLELKMTTAYLEEPFEEWLAQVQWQMYVTGSTRATIAALCGGDAMRWWDIDRDDVVIEALKNSADLFLENCLMRNVPPPSDGSEHSRAAIKQLYPESDGTEVTFDMDDHDRVLQIVELRNRIAALDKEEGTLIDALKLKMGKAQVGYLPNGGKITWKSFPKQGYYVKPQTVRPFKIDPEPPAPKGRKQ